MQFANIRSMDTVLKAARGKKILTCRGKNIRITSDLSTGTWQARKGWQGIFKALTENNMQPRILYPARLSFRIDGEIRTFQNWQSLTNFVSMKPALQEILRGGPIKVKRPQEWYRTEIYNLLKKDFTSNMTSLKSYLSIVSLNVNGLNAPVNPTGVQIG